MKATVKTRYVGTCPVCQQRQKLGPAKGNPQGGSMVHHGFRRPGDGAIHGDCFGVRYLPYEVSYIGCTHYRDHAQDIRTNFAAHLVELESGAVRELFVERYVGFRETKRVLVSADSPDPSERDEYERALRFKISRTQGEIKLLEHGIVTMQRLIAEWSPKPVITFEEHLELVAAERKAKREERERLLAAVHAERRRKATELKQKRERWELEKQALIAKYKALFEELAARENNDNNTGRRYEALHAWREMFKAKARKGYLEFFTSELGCDEALITLGLALRVPNVLTPDGWVNHATSTGFVRGVR